LHFEGKTGENVQNTVEITCQNNRQLFNRYLVTMMKYLILFTLFSSSAFAGFTVEFIEPFLGKYDLKKARKGQCPRSLNLMAACSLGELTLHHSTELDFLFERFTGIGAGELKTSNEKEVIRRSTATLTGQMIVQKEKVYMSNYKRWLELDKSLKLSKNGMRFKRFSAGKKRADCEYALDKVAKAKAEAEYQAYLKSQKK